MLEVGRKLLALDPEFVKAAEEQRPLIRTELQSQSLHELVDDT